MCILCAEYQKGRMTKYERNRAIVELIDFNSLSIEELEHLLEIQNEPLDIE